MTRPRANPYPQGTPEHLLHRRWKLCSNRAAELAREAQRLQVDADAEQAKADHYARALEALNQSAVKPLQIAGPSR